MATVSFGQSEFFCNLNDVIPLQAVFDKDYDSFLKTCIWSTSNSNVISLEKDASTGDNNCTAVGYGIAEVTATFVLLSVKISLVFVVSENGWLSVSLGKYFNVDDYGKILGNVLFIKKNLIDEGIEDYKPIVKFPAYSTPFVDMFDFLQNMEYNFDGLVAVFEANGKQIPPSYEAAVIVGDYAHGREKLQRWINILDEAREILND